MTREKAAEQKEQMTIVVNDKEDRKGKLKSIGGSQSDKWNSPALGFCWTLD